MLSNENEALTYIDENKTALLDELEEHGIKNIYTNENTRINVIKDGKRLYKVVSRFEEDSNLIDIYKEMIDLKLF